MHLQSTQTLRLLTYCNYRKAKAFQVMYVDAATLDTNDKIRDAVKKYTVFGRVKPEQKKQIAQESLMRNITELFENKFEEARYVD